MKNYKKIIITALLFFASIMLISCSQSSPIEDYANKIDEVMKDLSSSEEAKLIFDNYEVECVPEENYVSIRIYSNQIFDIWRAASYSDVSLEEWQSVTESMKEMAYSFFDAIEDYNVDNGDVMFFIYRNKDSYINNNPDELLVYASYIDGEKSCHRSLVINDNKEVIDYGFQ